MSMGLGSRFFDTLRRYVKWRGEQLFLLAPRPRFGFARIGDDSRLASTWKRYAYPYR